MRTMFSVVIIALAAVFAAGIFAASNEPIPWAYAIPPAPPAGSSARGPSSARHQPEAPCRQQRRIHPRTNFQPFWPRRLVSGRPSEHARCGCPRQET